MNSGEEAQSLRDSTNTERRQFAPEWMFVSPVYCVCVCVCGDRVGCVCVCVYVGGGGGGGGSWRRRSLRAV